MSVQEDKHRHQQEYQHRVEAVRAGRTKGSILQQRPVGIVMAKNARSFDLYSDEYKESLTSKK